MVEKVTDMKKVTETFHFEDRGNCSWLKVRSSDLIRTCRNVMAQGAIFDSAFISSQGNSSNNSFTVYYLFRATGVNGMLLVQSEGQEFSALSATTNAALWDERKMQDLTGLKFADIPDSRPLIFHAESGMPAVHPVGGRPLIKPKTIDYAMEGTTEEGEFEIAVGPVHAGIIEPGHFRFHVIGEQVNKLEVRMFYLHRGIEKATEGKSVMDILPIIEQISGDESVANSVAYCHSIERALGLRVPQRAEFIRAIFLELERIYSHLADLGGMPTDVGFTLSASRFAVLREDMMRLNQFVCGNRFLRGACVVGGVNKDLQKDQLSLIIKTLADFEKRLDGVERMTLKSSTYLDRVFSTGTVSKRAAVDLALVGPVARACGISCDLRKTLPYSVYAATPFNESIEKTGDVLARYLVKLAEVKESAKLINWLISNMPCDGLRSQLNMPQLNASSGGTRECCVGVGWTEAPRGGCTFLVEVSSDRTIRRLACRTASFRNWRGIERAIEHNIVPDFPLINKSFNMSYAGTDL